jgi:cbb3-type cytochrome oxidase maturation protein
MSVIFIVLPLAILVVGGAVLAFVWGVRHGQFDDLDTPAMRVAMDDDTPARGAHTKPDAGGDAGATCENRHDGAGG